MKKSAETRTPPTPARQLAGFLAKFDPSVARLARAALAKLRKRMPTAFQLVYDNYNALAIGFSPTERAGDVIASVALYPRWVSLFFMQGAKLPDPSKVLRGSGNQVRHIVLTAAANLDEPAVRILFEEAIRRSKTPLPAEGRGRLLIKSVSAKQRPRRPEA